MICSPGVVEGVKSATPRSDVSEVCEEDDTSKHGPGTEDHTRQEHCLELASSETALEVAQESQRIQEEEHSWKRGGVRWGRDKESCDCEHV